MKPDPIILWQGNYADGYLIIQQSPMPGIIDTQFTARDVWFNASFEVSCTSMVGVVNILLKSWEAKYSKFLMDIKDREVKNGNIFIH